MTKNEMAGYLASLITIIRDKEDGARPAGDTLTWEYERIYDQFREQLGKERENETRKSDGEQRGFDKGRTEVTSNQPSISGATRSPLR